MTSRVRKARIPVDAGKRIVFSEDEWRSIERAYGQDLPQPIRAAILLATDVLRLVGRMERNAPERKRMIAKTKKSRDAVRSLLQETDWPVEEDVAWPSFEAMTERTATAVKDFPYNHLQFLMVAYSFVAGCNLMLREWKADEGLRVGSAWDAWVLVIAEVLEHYGLPTAARKDSDKRDSAKVNSPFVWLIQELEKRIPKDLRPQRAPDALTQAIHRARKKGWPEILPPSIKAKFAAYLDESPQERAKRSEFVKMIRTSPDWVEVTPGSFTRVEMLELMKP
jgi:hypothetical protein